MYEHESCCLSQKLIVVKNPNFIQEFLLAGCNMEATYLRWFSRSKTYLRPIQIKVFLFLFMHNGIHQQPAIFLLSLLWYALQSPLLNSYDLPNSLLLSNVWDISKLIYIQQRNGSTQHWRSHVVIPVMCHVDLFKCISCSAMAYWSIEMHHQFCNAMLIYWNVSSFLVSIPYWNVDPMSIPCCPFAMVRIPC